MLKAYLTRFKTSDQGTFGIFSIPDIGFMSVTCELPWRNNEPNVSCIPQGEYVCKVVNSPRYGKAYEVIGVDGRTHILHHIGNWGGDVELGYKSDILGCIVHGRKFGILSGQDAVISSGTTIKELMKVTQGADLDLKIVEIY